MRTTTQQRYTFKLAAVALFGLGVALAGCSCDHPGIKPKPDPITPPPPKTCIPYELGLVFPVQKKTPQVRSVAWSVKGDRYATVNEEGWIQVRDAVSAIILESYRYDAPTSVRKIVFNTDGSAVLTAGDDGVIRMWRGGKEEQAFLPPKLQAKVLSLSLQKLADAKEPLDLFAAGYQTVDGKGVIMWQSVTAASPYIATRKETGAPVHSLAMRSGNFLTAVGLADGSIELRDANSGERLAQLNGAHQGIVSDVAWSADGNFFASGGIDQKIKIWKVSGDTTQATATLVQTLESHRYPVTSLAFAPSGKFLVSTSYSTTNGYLGEVRLWDVTSLKTEKPDVRELPQLSYLRNQGTLQVAWNQDAASSKLLLANYRGEASVWVVEGAPVFLADYPQKTPITSVVFSRDEQKWAYGSQEGKIFVKTFGTDAKVLEHSVPAPVVRVEFEPDTERAIAILANGEVHCWDWKQGVVSSHAGPGKPATSLAVRRDVSGFVVGYEDGSMMFFSSQQMNAPLGQWPGLHKAAITSTAWSQDGSLLVTSSKDGTVKVWSFDTPQQAPQLKQTLTNTFGAIPTLVQFNSNSSKLAVGMTGGYLGIWESFSGNWKVHPTEYGTSIVSWERSLASKDLLITSGTGGSKSSPNAYHMWDTTDPNTLSYIHTVQDAKNGHSKDITDITFNWNDQALLTSSLDGTLKLWKIRRAYPILGSTYSSSPISLAARPDADQVVAGTTDSFVHMWKLNSIPVPSQRLLQGHNQAVRHIAISSSGEKLFTAGLDGKLFQWDLTQPNPTVVRTFPDAASDFKPVTNLTGFAFSPDETQIALVGFQATPNTQSNLNMGQLTFWSVKDPVRPLQVIDGIRRFSRIAWHPTKDIIVTTHNGGAVRIWEKVGDTWKLQRELLDFHPLHSTAIAFEPKKGDLVASTGLYGDIRVWRLEDGKLLHRFDSGGANVAALQFHPNASILAAALSNGQIKMWDTSTGKLVRSLVDPNIPQDSIIRLAHENSVSSMAWSVDGNTLFTGGGDFKIKQWNCTNK